MGEWWASVRRVLGYALSLDPEAATRLPTEPPVAAALGILAITVGSIGIGHLGVLVLNRVTGRHICGAFVLGIVVMAGARALSAVGLWAIASLVTDAPVRLGTVFWLVVVALAPQVFGAFTVVPHAGLFLGRVLQAWELLILFVGVQVLYDVSRWRSALIVGLAFAASQIAIRLLAAPGRALVSALWTRASGRPMFVTARDLLSGAPVVPVEADAERGAS
ncbi:MAG: hypothetical protein IPL36_04885 [Nigerium sp.]|nr:hypothetical protein [Nigerium sp.]